MSEANSLKKSAHAVRHGLGDRDEAGTQWTIAISRRVYGRQYQRQVQVELRTAVSRASSVEAGAERSTREFQGSTRSRPRDQCTPERPAGMTPVLNERPRTA